MTNNTFGLHSKILIAHGSESLEDKVSMNSATFVQNVLSENGYHNAYLQELTPDNTTSVILSNRPDVVFNAMHGHFGEDGQLQVILDTLEIPYTHSGAITSSIAMNKIFTKAIAIKNNISVVTNYCIVSGAELLSGEYKYIAKKAGLVGKVVCKPVSFGSSIGLSIGIIGSDEMNENVLASLKFFSKIDNISFLIEEFVQGREIQVMIIDRPDMEEIIDIAETVSTLGIYSYESKYTNGGSKHLYDPDISKSVKDNIFQDALKLYKKLNCRGMSRLEFIVEEGTERAVLLEINTHPGLTSLSYIPEVALRNGLSHVQFIEYMLRLSKFDPARNYGNV